MKKTAIISAVTAVFAVLCMGGMTVGATTRNVTYDEASGKYIDAATKFAYVLDEDTLTASVYGNPDGAADSVKETEVGILGPDDETITVNDFAYGADSLVPASVSANGKTYTVTEVAPDGFADHTTLGSVSFESDVKIGERAFFGCSSLKNLDLTGVRTISDSAFAYTKLETLSLPTTVESIGGGAFFYIPTLKTVNGLGANVKYIGSNPFGGSEWFKKLDDDFVILGDGILIKYNGSDEHLVLPSNVKGVTDAFSGNTALTSVDMSAANVTYIGDNAFYGCHNLGSVTFPESLVNIGDFAFASCSLLREVEFGENIESIGFCAFSSALSMQSFTCASEKLTRLGECAFWNCKSLETATFASSPATLDFGLFWNSGLKTFIVSGNVTTLAKGAFASVDGARIIVPRNVVNIDGTALAGENLVIVCAPDAAAAVYGKLNFTEDGTNRVLLYGDVNGDGKVDAEDILFYLKNAASSAEAETVADEEASDVDLDGMRTLKDIRAMMRYLAGEEGAVVGR